MLKEKEIDKLRSYFTRQPVEKVWLFGSFARGEERADSDVDLLVAFDPSSNVSLFTMGGMYMDLRKLLGRDVDLIEDGTLEDYAAATAANDKTLIYERAS